MKTMKKNIVLKLLTGVVTTTITATGIAVPMMVGSEQNREDVSVIVDEDIQVAETVVDTEIISDETNIVEDEAVAEDEAIVEEDAEAEDTAEVKDDAEVEEDEATDTESAQLTSTPEQAAQSTSISEQLVQPATPAPATPEPVQPVHTHNWKEHTETKQVWVPNIVVVGDYEYRVVGHVDAVAVCNCGYTTTDSSAMESHVVNHAFAGENTQFTVHAGYDIIEEVKVGSHEEDKGHYETQTYVDYYYCDCSATK